MHPLFDDMKGASGELGHLLIDLSETFPGALPYVARPAVADRLGLHVAVELGNLVVGLISPDEGAAKVLYWDGVLRQRSVLDRETRTDHLPVPLQTVAFLALTAEPEGVWAQWFASVRHTRGN